MKLQLYCKYCGSAQLTLLETDSGYRCRACGEHQYLNSKPSVQGLIWQEDQVLLVSDRVEADIWSLPGGFLNHGEDPTVGLRREVQEELSINVSVGRLLDAHVASYGTNGEYSLILYYRIDDFDQNFHPSNEIQHARWFSMTELPNSLSRKSRELIKEHLPAASR